jgi:hypothetical protein
MNILQWILTKLGTYLGESGTLLIFKVKGQRTKYVPSLVKIHRRMLILECSQGWYAVNNWSGDLDLWHMTLKINYPLANEVAMGYSNATILQSVCPYHPCEHSRIDILQWILTKLGTYLVLKRIWNPIDFQSKVSIEQETD